LKRRLAETIVTDTPIDLTTGNPGKEIEGTISGTLMVTMGMPLLSKQTAARVKARKVKRGKRATRTKTTTTAMIVVTKVKARKARRAKRAKATKGSSKVSQMLATTTITATPVPEQPLRLLLGLGLEQPTLTHLSTMSDNFAVPFRRPTMEERNALWDQNANTCIFRPSRCKITMQSLPAALHPLVLVLVAAEEVTRNDLRPSRTAVRLDSEAEMHWFFQILINSALWVTSAEDGEMVHVALTTAVFKRMVLLFLMVWLLHLQRSRETNQVLGPPVPEFLPAERAKPKTRSDISPEGEVGHQTWMVACMLVIPLY